MGTWDTAAKHESVVKNRIYIIDFDTSRQFSLGPGVQQAITLPGTVQVPPNGLTSFDPYSWDVYCMGRTLEQVIRVRQIYHTIYDSSLSYKKRVADRTRIREASRLTGSRRSTSSGWLGTNGSEAALVYAAADPPRVLHCES